MDGLKCLAKDPMQFVDDNYFSNATKDSTTSLSQTVSLESILGQ